MGFDFADEDVFADAVQGLSEEVAREAANRWFSASQDILLDEGDTRDYEVFPVVQSGQPPQRDDDGYRFGYGHVASPFFEHGTEPHEIEAKRAEYLAFEWPDAPQEVREMFEETFPTVFFKSVEHPGTPALNYMRRARSQAARWAEGQQ